jgi:hypothetical protein
VLREAVGSITTRSEGERWACVMVQHSTRIQGEVRLGEKKCSLSPVAVQCNMMLVFFTTVHDVHVYTRLLGYMLE